MDISGKVPYTFITGRNAGFGISQEKEGLYEVGRNGLGGLSDPGRMGEAARRFEVSGGDGTF